MFVKVTTTRTKNQADRKTCQSGRDGERGAVRNAFTPESNIWTRLLFDQAPSRRCHSGAALKWSSLLACSLGSPKVNRLQTFLTFS